MAGAGAPFDREVIKLAVDSAWLVGRRELIREIQQWVSREKESRKSLARMSRHLTFLALEGYLNREFGGLNGQ